jgi:hypothetical protein
VRRSTFDRFKVAIGRVRSHYESAPVLGGQTKVYPGQVVRIAMRRVGQVRSRRYLVRAGGVM